MATRHALALLLALAAAPLCAAWGGQLGRTPSTSTASRSSAAVRAVAARTAPTMLFGRGEARAAAVESAEYDYIVVGGGTAGCVLANRLTDQPDTRVLVLEAGTRAHKSMIVKAPVGLMKIFKSKLDWNFQTAPSQDLKGREVYICRGKMLGGSSCANVVLYNRGAAADYDAWADECGDPTWNAENLLPYFKKAQNCVSKENSGVGEWHGAGGPQTVSDVPYQNKMSKAFLEAAQQAGGQLNADFNDWSRAQTGFGRYQVMEKRGRRSDAASSYLDPVRGRPNLDVVTGAQATGVVLDGSKRATGVRFVDADGVERVATLASNGEALLALGAIGSPHLLMTSGVGPADHLKERGVNVRARAGDSAAQLAAASARSAPRGALCRARSHARAPPPLPTAPVPGVRRRRWCTTCPAWAPTCRTTRPCSSPPRARACLRPRASRSPRASSSARRRRSTRSLSRSSWWAGGRSPRRGATTAASRTPTARPSPPRRQSRGATSQVRLQPAWAPARAPRAARAAPRAASLLLACLACLRARR